MRPAAFLGVLLLALSSASQSAAQDVPAGAREGDPIEMLLEISEELALTPAQVQRIREIQRDLEARNRPLVDRLVEVQRRVQAQLASGDSGSAGPSRAHLEIARAPMRRIQENIREAMEEVGEVLTRAQRRRAEEVLDLPDDGDRGRRGRRQ